jgi:hypothetical protein
MSSSTDSINVLELINASHGDLLAKRAELPDDDPLQQLIAPFEHRAFAREQAQTSPLSTAITMPFMIPGYAMMKALGLQSGRTPASIEQVKQGYIGLHEGLKASLFGTRK